VLAWWGGNAYDGPVESRGRPRNQAVGIGSCKVCEVARNTERSENGFEESCERLGRRLSQ